MASSLILLHLLELAHDVQRNCLLGEVAGAEIVWRLHVNVVEL